MTDPRLFPGPLAGLRVLEIGQLLAGPFCGQILGDLGAEVIKVEPPGAGDPMREWGREKPHGLSLWWPVVARNKKSISCDLRTTAGQGLARRLAATADVLVENLRPGTLERWNLGTDTLQELNARLVIVRVTGFGQTGPYATRPGYGSIGESMGGLRYVTGDPTVPPSRVGISIGDALAGMFGAIGALAAITVRDRVKRGQVVDVALYEAVLALMESLIPEYALGGYIRERTGAVLPNVAPSNVYPTADGQMVLIAANQDSVFMRLAEAMGSPELGSDPRYATHAARGQHQRELDELIADWTSTMEHHRLLKMMDAHAVPSGLIYRAPDMLSDPHFAAREAIVRVPHPDLGEIPMQNVVPKLSATPGQVRWVGPELGQHNREVYGSVLGLTDAEIGELTKRRVI